MSTLLMCDFCGKTEDRDIGDRHIVYTMEIEGPINKMICGKHYHLCEKCRNDLEEWRKKRINEKEENNA